MENSHVHFVGKVAVKIFLVDSVGGLLLVSEDKRVFEVPGGRIDVGESINETIKRELFEELQIEIQNIDFDIISSFQSVNPNENINHLYLIVLLNIEDSQKTLIRETDEVREFVWVDGESYKNYKIKNFLLSSIENYFSKMNLN